MAKNRKVVMKIIKKRVFRLLWMLQIICWAGYYLYGENGYHAMSTIKKENEQVLHDIEHLQQDITVIEQEVVAWQTDLFYVEKVAREQLQMAKDGEELYFIG